MSSSVPRARAALAHTAGNAHATRSGTTGPQTVHTPPRTPNSTCPDPRPRQHRRIRTAEACQNCHTPQPAHAGKPPGRYTRSRHVVLAADLKLTPEQVRSVKCP